MKSMVDLNSSKVGVLKYRLKTDTLSEVQKHGHKSKHGEISALHKHN